MCSTLLIFIDGLGIGENNSVKNPFFRKKFKFFEEIFGKTPYFDNQELYANGKYLFPINATMNVQGLPQSGTGQTSIFCGVNAPKIIGQHFGPYPYSTLKPIIEKDNIFNFFKDKSLDVCFANGFPKVFFDYINSGRKRLNVTSLMALGSNVKMLDVDDMIAGKGISSDITNRRWNTKLKYSIPTISPEEAGQRLLNITLQNSFTLFEYFFTDHLGHGRNKDEFDILLNDLDRFLFKVISDLPSDTTLLICSDHGNLEDISIKSHTKNPTLAISAGKNAEMIKTKIRDLSDIKSAICDYY